MNQAVPHAGPQDLLGFNSHLVVVQLESALPAFHRQAQGSQRRLAKAVGLVREVTCHFPFCIHPT